MAYSSPSPDFSWVLLDHPSGELSRRRAAAARDYLVNNHGIEANRFIVRGYGEAQPIADNTTAEGRRLNRRVEVLFSSILPE